MLVGSHLRVRKAGEGVSEVVGTLLLLAMTVVAFSIIFLWVSTIQAPDTEVRVNLFPTLDRIDDKTANVSITHRGGESIPAGSVVIYFTIDNATTNGSLIKGPYNFTSGSPQEQWGVGGVWSRVVPDMPEDAWIQITVIDRLHETVILRSELQRGNRGGDTAPILGSPVALPDWEVAADGRDLFYVQAAAVDYDDDLPSNGVTIDLSPLEPSMGTVTFIHKGFGLYETSKMALSTAVDPGTYSLTVTATDLRGNTDSAVLELRVVSADKEPPNISFIRPNSGEIAAGTASIIVAAYNDPSGIDTTSVTLQVWEDDISLDTSAKTVTDSMVAFRPFGGFRTNSFYLCNASVKDKNGNIGYAETMFRLSLYSEPGNPRGDTHFLLMNRTWQSTTVFEHDDYVRVQLYSEILRRVDNSELRFTRSDVYSVVLQDRFVPNLTVPQHSQSFPYYVYDATVRIQTDGQYGGPIEPGFYTLKIMAAYPDMNVVYENDVAITILYEDESMPDNGRFFLYNESKKWVTPTNTFFNEERVYVQLVADHAFETATSPITEISKVMVTIKDIYGDVKLYVEVPREQVTYMGPGMGGYVYRFAFNLTDTIAGGTWLFGANWYPIDIAVQTKSDYKRDQAWKWWKNYSAYQIEYTAGDQMRIIWPGDVSIVDADIVLFHGDGTTLEENATIGSGEKLFVSVIVRNLGKVDLYRVDARVALVSSGTTLMDWNLYTDSDFWDPNFNGILDADAGINYVAVNLTWNTSKGGFPLALLRNSTAVVRLSILTPVIGGYGSDPIPETNYDNNAASKRIIPISEGKLTVVCSGFATPAGVDVGEQTFQVMKLTCAATGGAVRINGINVTLLGTAQTSDISQVAVFRDNNPNGVLDRGDRLIAKGAFVGGVFKVTDKAVVPSGSTVVYLIVYDISSTAVATRTCGAAITSAAAVSVQAPAYVQNVGFPLNSGLATINANSNQLTGAISGPTGVFIESTARYTVVFSGQNTVPAKAGQGSLTIVSLKLSLTNSGYLTKVRLVDDAGYTIQELAPAATVTFTGMAYRVKASASRTMYIELDLGSTAPEGALVGVAFSKSDVTLSCAADSVLNTLSLSKTSTVRTMAFFFAYGATGPTLDAATRTNIDEITLTSTDASVDIQIVGIVIEWTLYTRPDYTTRIYIDGVMVFMDDGLNHVGSGGLIILGSPVRLSTTGESTRIYFDTFVTGQVSAEKRNDFTITWVFSDGSTSNGGKYILCQNDSASWKSI